jgi:hypothetical protein
MPRPLKNPYMDNVVEHRGYCITVKKDFNGVPVLVDGLPVLWGYVVHKAGEKKNAMPNDTWFQSVKNAKHAIDVLIDVGGAENEEQFWAMLRTESACRHMRYVRGPEIQTAHGIFVTHVCTQCGDWRTETNALSNWQPAATLAVETALPHGRDGRHEVQLTEAPRTH